MALKKLVVEKERELLEKRKTLEKLRQEKERGNSQEGKREVQINQFQRLCIQKLQERIQYLQERASKIKQELESVKNTQSDPKLLVQMEEILDLIHSNQVLERYIQSENFRVNQDSILLLKQEFLRLQKVYSQQKEQRELAENCLEQSKKELFKKQEELQRKQTGV